MIGESVRAGLRRDGFALDWVRDGETARSALESEHYDAMLLDLGLPRLDGLSLLRELRGSQEPRASLPVLVITARDSISDRVGGLDAGADDYLVKPFDFEELAARLRALLRRHAGRTESLIEFGGLQYDTAARTLRIEGEPVVLSARELTILEALMDRPGAVLSKQQLEDRVYGWSEQVGSNAIEVHIHALRKKIGASRIRTVRGVGYMLVG